MNRWASFSASFSITGCRAANHASFRRLGNELRPRVAILGRDFRQGNGDIQFGDRRGSRLNPRRVSGAQGAKRLEDFALNRQHFLFGLQNLDFQLLQLRRGEAFGVDQRLFALIIGGRKVQVGFRNFEVVAEDIVEADFQRPDAGAAALALLDLRQIASCCSAKCRAARPNASKPSRIAPPSARFTGGSSASAVRTRSRTSAISSSRPLIFCKRSDFTAASRCFSDGTTASDRASAATSRGPALARLIFDSSRSRSRIDREILREFAPQDRAGVQFLHRIQPRFDLRRRRSTAPANAAAAGVRPSPCACGRARRAASNPVDSPANRGSTSSRLRTVVASSTSASARL